MSIEDFLLQQAENQLKSHIPAVSDGSWLDGLVKKIRDNVSKADVNEDFKTSSLAATDVLIANKDKIVGLGSQAFTLFLHQVASGQQQNAIHTYVQAYGSVDQIIQDMDAGTHGLIAAKKRLDQWYLDALNLMKEITLQVAKVLLPLALALL